MNETPQQLANKVIRMLIDHLFTEDMITEKIDYDVIRLVFRQLKGSWLGIDDGSPGHIDLLTKIVTAWGLMPNRRKKSQEDV